MARESSKALYVKICATVFAGILAGCNGSTNTVVLDWTRDMPSSGDSVATAFAEVLGDAPDSLQRCSNKRVRLAFVNGPGAFPMRGRTEGNSFIQSGPGSQVERNLVRSIAYASAEPLERFGIDTVVVTLTRSSRGAGEQRSSYEVVRGDLNNGYSMPVGAISLAEQPCGSTRK